MTVLRRLLLAFGIALLVAVPARSQTPGAFEPTVSSPSPGRAFLLSLALPGLGHRHANGGSWGKSGTFFALADAALWSGLLGSGWHRGQVIDSYRALAVTGANADMDGKDRTFTLRLATFRSSDEFVDFSLRNRAWGDIGYVDDPAFRWSWDSEEDFLQFRDLREQSESLGRRRTAIIATLVANRLISGFFSARNARNSGRAGTSDLAVSLRPPARGTTPILDLSLRF